MGLFLIYPKREAIHAFSVFVAKYQNGNRIREYAMDLLEQLDSSFRRVGMDFIPHITADNYRNESMFNNFDSDLTGYDELEVVQR